MGLATRQILAKQYDDAITNMKLAVETASLKPDFSLEPDNFYEDTYWQLRNLAEAGRQEDAEALHLRLLERTKGLFGTKSSEYTAALTNLFAFYGDQKNQVKALHYLDQIFEIDPQKQQLGNLCIYDDRHKILTTASGWARKGEQRDFGMLVLRKLLDSQKKLYGSDDRHVCLALTQLGTLEAEQGELDQAEKYLQSAFAISALYDYEQGTGAAKFALDSLFAKEHKTEESEKLKESWELAQKGKYTNGPLTAKSSLDETQCHYDHWLERAPYAYSCLFAGLRLLESAVKQKDWPRVRELAPECINLLAHQPVSDPGGCEPGPSPAGQKFFCYKSEIEALLEGGQTAEAHKWVDRALSEKSYLPSISELKFLSEIENVVGNKQEALAYCREAEQSLSNEGGRTGLYNESVVDLYTHLGAKADGQRLTNEARAEKLKTYETELHKFESARKLKAVPGADSKDTPRIVTVSNGVVRKGQKSDDEWTAEPNDYLKFPPVAEIKEKYLFKYAALASEALWLEDGSCVKRLVAQNHLPTYSFAGGFNYMSTEQPMHQAGELNFLYDGPAGSLIPKFELPGRTTAGDASTVNRGQIFTAPPAIMARPFMAAPKAPVTATALGPNTDKLILKPGDYKAEHITAGSIVLPKTGRVRIFLKDDAPSVPSRFMEPRKRFFDVKDGAQTAAPIFDALANARVNAVPATEEQSPRRSLEIWYNGSGTLKLGDNTHFDGIIYAPNAVIRLGNSVRFLGAIVAKDIITGTNTTIMYQYQLKDWKPD
jgi:hypothetical protein